MCSLSKWGILIIVWEQDQRSSHGAGGADPLPGWFKKPTLGPDSHSLRHAGGARWVEALTCMVMCWLATGYWPQSHPCHTAWVSWWRPCAANIPATRARHGINTKGWFPRLLALHLTNNSIRRSRGSKFSRSLLLPFLEGQEVLAKSRPEAADAACGPDMMVIITW